MKQAIKPFDPWFERQPWNKHSALWLFVQPTSLQMAMRLVEEPDKPTTAPSRQTSRHRPMGPTQVAR